MSVNLCSIAIGEKKVYTKNDSFFYSSYKKDIFSSKIEVCENGILGDTQSDRKFHGGNDKAIHIACNRHFAIFENMYNMKADKLSFGCNILVDELDESDVYIGDIYSIGKIQIEVSQPRQACWKIAAIFDKHISRYILKNQATGWYVRVLNDGIINIEDKMILKKRVSNISIKYLTKYLFSPPNEKELISEILNTKALSQSYKDDLLKSCEKNNNRKK